MKGLKQRIKALTNGSRSGFRRKLPFHQPFAQAYCQSLPLALMVLDALYSLALKYRQIHHIIDDAASTKLLIREIQAHLDGEEERLPVPVPFRDHVAHTLDPAAMEEAEAFFSEKLGSVGETTAPYGLTDVHGDVSRIEEVYEHLGIDLARRVRHQARRQGVSTASLFHAAWALVIARTTGKDDVVFGTVLLGRLHTEAGTRRVLGMFINTLPLRLRLTGMSARDLLATTQKELVGLMRHESASLAHAQKRSGLAGTSPLFTALLNYRHSSPGDDTDKATAAGITVLAFQERTNYPITLAVDDFGEEFGVSMATDRTINPQSMVGYLRTALLSLVETLEEDRLSKVLTLPVLPESELRVLLEEFNATERSYGGRCIQELFEEQVLKCGGSVAVQCDQEHLSYAGLNERANRLAWRLRELGVGPGRLVGICVERGIEMVVGVLGVLKAGGAYVPLDPAFPADRLAYMLEDASPAVLLTQERVRAGLPVSAAQVLTMEEAWDQGELQRAGNLSAGAVGLDSEQLAYVMYTSGSTGRPKGVEISHAAVSNFIASMREQPGCTAEDVLLSVTTLSFDICGLELFLPLSTGARVVLASQSQARDPQLLIELLRQAEPTLMQATPSLWRMLIEAGWEGSARLSVLCGGEALTDELADELLQRCGRLWNMYGPTETTIWSTLQRIEAGSPIGIGRPIANTRVYILDEQLQPVPMGVAGELCIAGAGVARGYRGQEMLTGERFVRCRIQDREERMYRTGDVARWLPQGYLAHLGRLDEQVKIRGHRIELGEIESVLREHERVREVAVIAREDAPGDKRLVAYVVEAATAQEAQWDIAPLRGHLRARVPEYMVPGAFVRLERLPLTVNGKLDRRALQAMQPQSAQGAGGYEAPRGELEQTLERIWAQVLRLPRVGIHDNFFDVGGTSLMAIKIIARAHREMLHLTARDLFEAPTIAALTSRVTREERPARDALLATASPPESDSTVVPPMVAKYLAENAERLKRNVFVLCLESTAPLKPDLLAKACHALVAQHEALRASVVKAGHEWRLRVHEISAVKEADLVDVEDLSLRPPAELNEVLREIGLKLAGRIELGCPPLMRVVLCNCGSSEPPRLVIALHHCAYDPIAFNSIVRDLQTAYEQVRESAQMAACRPDHTLRAWLAHIEEYSESPDATRQIPYWQKVLSNPDASRVFGDISAVEGEAAGVPHVVTRDLSLEETDALLRLAPRVLKAQIDELLITAVARALGCWIDRDSVSIRHICHGRESLFPDIDVSETVGWFSVEVPLLLDGRERLGLQDALSATASQIRSVPQGGLAYSVLRHIRKSLELTTTGEPKVIVNHLGNMTSHTSVATVGPSHGAPMFCLTSAFAAISDAALYPGVLEVTTVAYDSRLRLQCAYDSHAFASARMEKVADDIVHNLRRLALLALRPDPLRDEAVREQR